RAGRGVPEPCWLPENRLSRPARPRSNWWWKKRPQVVPGSLTDSRPAAFTKLKSARKTRPIASQNERGRAIGAHLDTATGARTSVRSKPRPRIRFALEAKPCDSSDVDAD